MELELKNYQNRHSSRSKILRAGWNVVWTVLGKWTPEHSRIFNLWRIGLLKLFGAKVGKGCIVKSSCEVWQPWNLSLGDYVALSENVICYTVDKISIGSQTTISRDAFLCCASHDVTSPVMELTNAPITIGANAWIAARAIIMPGRKVGEGAIVAAGAVVVNDVAPWKIVVDRECGWWVDNDVNALGAVFSQLFNLSTSYLEAMGQNGRELVEEKYTWKAVCDKMVTSYKEVLNGKA